MTMNNEIYTNEIAAHEAGHCLALAATGLADEFQSCTIVSGYDAQRRPTCGLTIRSGASLTRFREKLDQHSQRLAAQEESVNDFKDFLMKNVPKTCLPHICFFFGGGSFDRFLGREDTHRNSIDMKVLWENVVPSIAIQVTDKEFAELQGKVDEFLWAAFKANEALLKIIYDALVERETITANDDLLREMRAGAIPVSDAYQKLLAWFSEWYELRLNAVAESWTA